MHFALSDDQRAIQDAARAFADAELAPHSAKWDEDKHFPVETMKVAAEMGFCGIYTGEEHGGMALGRMFPSSPPSSRLPLMIRPGVARSRSREITGSYRARPAPPERRAMIRCRPISLAWAR